MKSKLQKILYLLFLSLALSSSVTAQDLALRKFLQHFAEKTDLSDVQSTRYIAAVVNLRDDNSEQVLVYLIGPAWCGTGGCLALILVPTESSYTIFAEISLAQQPIRVLDTKSNGWHDLGIWIQGGGVQPGYEARLSFDGKQYSANPPAQKMKSKTAGKIIVSSAATGLPLYPK